MLLWPLSQTLPSVSYQLINSKALQLEYRRLRSRGHSTQTHLMHLALKLFKRVSSHSHHSRWCSTPVRAPRSWASTASWKTPPCLWLRSESTPSPASPSITKDPKRRCQVLLAHLSFLTLQQPQTDGNKAAVCLSLQIVPQTSTTTPKKRKRATRQNRKAAMTLFMDRCV